MTTYNQMFSSSPRIIIDVKNCSTDSEQNVAGSHTDTDTQATPVHNLTLFQSNATIVCDKSFDVIEISSGSEEEDYDLVPEKNNDGRIVLSSLVCSEEHVKDGQKHENDVSSHNGRDIDMKSFTGNSIQNSVTLESSSSDDINQISKPEASRPNESVDMFNSIIDVSEVRAQDKNDSCNTDFEKNDILKLKSCHSIFEQNNKNSTTGNLTGSSSIYLPNSGHIFNVPYLNEGIDKKENINENNDSTVNPPRSHFLSKYNININLSLPPSSTKNSKKYSSELRPVNSADKLDDCNLVESSAIYRGIEEFTSTIKHDTSTVQDVRTFETVDPNESINDISGVIDESGENILNVIYGSTWRTPQLIKKCLSAKKDVSLKFEGTGAMDLYHLESTRKEPDQSDIKKNGDEYLDPRQKTLLNSTIQSNARQETNESNGNHNDSSKIVRSNRKVPANRILDYSSDDSNSDDDFRPFSDKKYEDSPMIKGTSRENKRLVYLDLTFQEVVEEEDHHKPDASVADLEAISKNFLQSLDGESYVRTPLPVKKIDAAVSNGKHFSTNHDDDLMFEEKPNTNDKTLTSITAKSTAPKSSNGKKQIPTATQVTTRTYGFLKSLNDDVSLELCDPYALKFRNNFYKNRIALVQCLMKIFNDKIFGNHLLGIPVIWSKKLTSTAGRCFQLKRNSRRICKIELSETLNTTAERVRDTCIHELCHAASWIIDKDFGNHGPIWKNWTKRAIQCIPELPRIEIYHHYEIDYKFTYKCSVCGLKSQARSKCKNVENTRCTNCHGAIEVFKNQKDENGQVILVKPKEISGFAKFVKETYKIVKVPGVTHATAMKLLSSNFEKLTLDEKLKYKN